MALGSTQPLVKMSTRDVPGGKGSRCVRLTTRNLGALTLLDPSGPAWPVMGVLYLYFYLSKINNDKLFTGRAPIGTERPRHVCMPAAYGIYIANSLCLDRLSHSFDITVL
jgi:hypothetical protein